MPAEYDFPVELRAISTEPDGFVIPHRRAVIRTDSLRALGVVSDKYALLSHADVVGTLRDTFTGQTVDEKIRMTHDGARMHIEFTLPEVSLRIDGDDIAMRLVVANSYDGSSKVQITFGAYRLVCSNGMIIGRKLLAINRRHVGEISLELSQVRKQVATLSDLFKATAPTMRKMTTRILTSPKTFFDPKTLLIPAYLTGIARQQFKQQEDGTVWDAYNGLTFAITHKMRKPNPDLAISLGKNAWTAAVAMLR